MISPEQKAILDMLRQHEQEIKRLRERANSADDRIATLNQKIERLKGTHGY